MTDDEDEVPDWFWDVIESTRPRVAALEAWLQAQPRETVARFALTYEDAASDLAEYWNGIVVDGVGWSVDDMEDLCDWVVSQGHTYWLTVRSGAHPLVDAAREYHAESGAWDAIVASPEHRGYASPAGIGHGVYWTRFGEDVPDD
ncbi:MAG TPA: hypothetical protein VFX16_11380 [Pseudonocardiaceae bacterium]|nr:hypothetical protein [Pseudonocardiaceae bacterium]